MPPSPPLLCAPCPRPTTALMASCFAAAVVATNGGSERPPRASPWRWCGMPGFSRRSAIKKSFHQEQGMHGLGGRMATRMMDDGGEQLVFDHAAQFFTASDERFQKLVEEWIEKGLVREWRGLIRELEAGGHFRHVSSSTRRYIGVNGMRPLADAMLPENDMIEVVRPCWISKLEPFNSLWSLLENEIPMVNMMQL